MLQVCVWGGGVGVCVCAFGATSVKICIHLCVREGGTEWANRHANEVGVMTHFCFVIVTQIEIEGKKRRRRNAACKKKQQPKETNTRTFMSSWLERSRNADTSQIFPCFESEQRKARQMLFIVLCLSPFLGDRDALIQMSTITSPCHFFFFFFCLRLPDAVVLTVVCKRRATSFLLAVYVCTHEIASYTNVESNFLDSHD